MVSISYTAMVTGISLLWLVARVLCFMKKKRIAWKRELLLLLVYICLIVVARFTFFPFSKVNGKIQPLIFDAAQAFPFRINLLPFVYLLDYPEKREIVLNIVGNITMFIPLGIIWPSVYRELNTHKKVIAAGAGVSLCVEILQLPFFDRVSDVDDLILNTLGFLAGYGLYCIVKKIKMRMKRSRMS